MRGSDATLSATTTTVSPGGEDVPHLVSAKSFHPLLSPTLCSATSSVPFLQPVELCQ